MAEPASDSRSPGPPGVSPQKPVGTFQTPGEWPHSPAPTPAPAIPDHELLACIGRGSYGEVWLARNVLGDYRAVKVIHRQRFESDHAYEREFEGLKRYEPVSRGDPSQVAVLHVGRNDSAGFYFYVMELADNANEECKTQNEERATNAPGSASFSESYAPRTLKSELMRRKRLPLDECIQVGLALTTALDHLHGHGLIHRDIKPSNVIFVKGVPKLADIGLVARIDATMSCVGTEGYIPPEGPGTAQADLYSLGKVLYEISSGKDRLAFPEPLTLLGEEPERVRLLELNAVIHRACHTDSKQRYQSTLAMQADLKRLERGESVRRRQLVQRRWATCRRVTVAALAMVALGLAAHSLYRTFIDAREMVPASEEHPVAVPLKASVFVLPFRSVGTNQASDALCSRITDAIIDSLALIEGVKRSPRKSGWRYLDEDELRHALAKTNNMRHVLTGRVSQSNSTLALTLRLYQRSGDRPLWTESFSGTTNELIALERRAVGELTGQLGLRVSTNDLQRIGILLTNNFEAFRFYQQAESVYTRKAGTKAGYTEVRDLARKAIDLDRLYVEADLWDAFMLRNGSQDEAPSGVWPDVQIRMQSIVERDDTLAIALDQLAAYELFYKRNWSRAYELWNRELAYRPPQDGPWLRALWCRVYGWFDEARVYQDQSEHPEPTNSDQRWSMASARWMEHRYAEGVQVSRRTLEIYPGHAEGYHWLAHCLVAKGDYVEGIEATLNAQKVWQKPEMTALRAFAYAKMGQPEKAREGLAELMGVERSGYLQPYFVARVHAALNERDNALGWLEKAEQDGSEYLFQQDVGGGLITDLAWDNLRDEPRFKELLRKTGLDQWPRPRPKPGPGDAIQKK